MKKMSHLKYAFLIQGILLIVFTLFIVDLNNIFINAIYLFQSIGHIAWASGEEQ